MSNFTPAWFKKGFFNESLFCDDFLSIVSVKTADQSVPAEARSNRRYKDHLIRFTAVGYRNQNRPSNGAGSDFPSVEG